MGDPRLSAREAVKSSPNVKSPDLGPSRLEQVTKNNLIGMKLTDPKKFEDLREASLDNSPLYQSWVDEVNEALSERPLPKKVVLKKNETYLEKFFDGSRIDLAKRIAKKQMFEALQRNWPWLKDTIFNEFGANQWRHPAVKPKREAEAPISDEGPSGADLAVEKLNEGFHYSPRHSDGSSFDFDFDFGGRNFVEIDRHSLKHGRVALDIDSDHDANRLEPGADKIQADDSGSSDNQSSQLVPVGGDVQPQQ